MTGPSSELTEGERAALHDTFVGSDAFMTDELVEVVERILADRVIRADDTERAYRAAEGWQDRALAAETALREADAKGAREAGERIAALLTDPALVEHVANWVPLGFSERDPYRNVNEAAHAILAEVAAAIARGEA